MFKNSNKDSEVMYHHVKDTWYLTSRRNSMTSHESWALIPGGTNELVSFYLLWYCTPCSFGHQHKFTQSSQISKVYKGWQGAFHIDERHLYTLCGRSNSLHRLRQCYLTNSFKLVL